MTYHEIHEQYRKAAEDAVRLCNLQVQHVVEQCMSKLDDIERQAIAKLSAAIKNQNDNPNAIQGGM